jgi:plastocyanin
MCLVGCNSKQAADEPPPLLQPTQQTRPEDAATISGVVRFEGSVPKPQKIDKSQDPACGNAPAFDESLVVNNGDLANVFVYVKAGLHIGGFGVGERPPAIEQRGCRYQPHVLGALVGETIEIVNADETTHNIHPMPTQSKQWNESQLPKDPPIIKKFDKSELMIPIKCNQHPWMKMYLNVVDNPWFAVTDENGKFKIKGLPPGEYTLAAVHEKLGEQDMKISVRPKESKTTDFSFKAQ